MKLYRVEFGGSGTCTSCIEVERGAPEGVAVFYIRATSRDSAIAKSAKVRQRDAQRARRAEYRRQGLCPDCGRKPLPHRIKCDTCLLSNRTRDHARSKGAKLRETRATREQQERLATLLEVQRELLEHGPALIGRWLCEQIAALTRRDARDIKNLCPDSSSCTPQC